MCTNIVIASANMRLTDPATAAAAAAAAAAASVVDAAAVGPTTMTHMDSFV